KARFFHDLISSFNAESLFETACLNTYFHGIFTSGSKGAALISAPDDFTTCGAVRSTGKSGNIRIKQGKSPEIKSRE
ncbi:MAG: hypothetical protein J6U38_05430, partial [Clostridia bacterium]|nr:hypothetical protein [Clostridia bacterium]